MPIRFRVLKANLEALGVSVEPPRGGGSHWQASRQGRRPYVIPAHSLNDEIADAYVRRLARQLDLDLDGVYGR